MANLTPTEEHMFEFFKERQGKMIASNDPALIAHYMAFNKVTMTPEQSTRYAITNLFKKGLLVRKMKSIKQMQMGLPSYRKIFHYKMKVF